MNLPGRYRGSSFIEFLKFDHPDPLPDFGGHDWSSVQMIHGTTVLALVFEDGAIMAGDRLATEGHAVGTRDIEKVFKIDDTCCMAIAGAAGPAACSTGLGTSARRSRRYRAFSFKRRASRDEWVAQSVDRGAGHEYCRCERR